MPRNGMKISQHAVATAYRAVRDHEDWSAIRACNPYKHPLYREKWEKMACHFYVQWKFNP